MTFRVEDPPNIAEHQGESACQTVLWLPPLALKPEAARRCALAKTTQEQVT